MVGWIVSAVVSIAPLMALYLKYRVVKFAASLMLFLALFSAFKMGMEFVIDTIMSKMTSLNFGCTASWIIQELDVMSMLNFGLSLWATIYIGRFFYNSVSKLI